MATPQDAAPIMKAEAETEQTGLKETEKDHVPNKKPTIKDAIVFHAEDTTMNVFTSDVGNILKSYGEGPIQQLTACARANIGLKSGRYMFEVKILEQLSRNLLTKQFFRAGLTTGDSSLFFSDATGGICIESDGSIFSGGSKIGAINQWINKDSILAIVVNLADGDENKNTISFFVDGVRACAAVPLPAGLVGKPLFPTVNFRHLSLAINFANPSSNPLPFTCELLGNAAKTDVTLKAKMQPKDGKYSVVCPVGVPGEGIFSWTDMFLEHNPGYTELSNRALLAWAAKSGIIQTHNPAAGVVSNDRPNLRIQINRECTLNFGDAAYHRFSPGLRFEPEAQFCSR